jgi:hypothetical protein
LSTTKNSIEAQNNSQTTYSHRVDNMTDFGVTRREYQYPSLFPDVTVPAAQPGEPTRATTTTSLSPMPAVQKSTSEPSTPQGRLSGESRSISLADVPAVDPTATPSEYDIAGVFERDLNKPWIRLANIVAGFLGLHGIDALMQYPDITMERQRASRMRSQACPCGSAAPSSSIYLWSVPGQQQPSADVSGVPANDYTLSKNAVPCPLFITATSLSLAGISRVAPKSIGRETMNKIDMFVKHPGNYVVVDMDVELAFSRLVAMHIIAIRASRGIGAYSMASANAIERTLAEFRDLQIDASDEEEGDQRPRMHFVPDDGRDRLHTTVQPSLRSAINFGNWLRRC